MDHWFSSNPRDVRSIGDPFVLRDQGYHLFATGGPGGFLHWYSEDLESFSRDIALRSVTWASGDYWAPEVWPWQGRYVMLFTARWKENGSLRIGIAVSDTPGGPYTDPLGKPLFDLGYAAIDATLLTDADGTPYLIYARDCSENVVEGRHESHLYGVRLSEDLMRTQGEAVCLTRPEQAWEMRSGDYLWNEGPSVLVRDGKYYLFYSANYYASREYGVGVAVAESPLGPYKKQENNPILSFVGTEELPLVSGPGHNAFFEVGDELFTSYHVHTFPDRPSGNRQLCIDRAGFHWDGTAYIAGPTLTPQLRPLADIGCVSLLREAQGVGDPNWLLCDGDICLSESSASYLWHGDKVTYAWESPVRAFLLLLYPAPGERITGTAVLDGERIPFDFTSDTPGAYCRISCPEIDFSTLTLTLSRGALGEIMLIAPAGEAP